MVQNVYSTESTHIDKPQIIITEFFPETALQRESMEEFSSRHLLEIAKTTKPDYVVSIDVRSADSRRYICSVASSFDGELRIKGLEVITKDTGEIEFKETDRFNSEYVNYTYIDPEEQKKKVDLDRKKNEMSGA
jgi:hypothetical protein